MRKRIINLAAAIIITTALLAPVLQHAPNAIAQPMTWDLISPDGFGFATPGEMSSPMCMAEYNGHLYAGTHNGLNSNGCAVWRYDGGYSWTQVASGGFGWADNKTVFCMAEYNGLLYAGTSNKVMGCMIWSFDGFTWLPVVGQGLLSTPTGPGFGSGNAVSTAGDMLVYDNTLYVAAGWGPSATGLCQVWAFDGYTWTQVNTDDFGDAANADCRALAAYNGKIYAGTENGTSGCKVYRYDGPNPTDWVQANPSGFNDINNRETRVMESWDGMLYAGTSGTDTPQVWAFDGTTWNNVTPTYPDGKNDSVRSMTVYKDSLYVGVGNFSGTVPPDNVGTQVYRYSGAGPEQVNMSGFDGDNKNQACHSLCEFRGDLYAGVINQQGYPPTYNGAEVWRTNFPSTWYLAEGSTDGGMETFVLVQNPGIAQVTVNLDFMTGAGAVPGPYDFPVPAFSRVTFKVNDYVTDYNVSTRVTPKGGDVICERAVYGNNRRWAHDSIGVTTPSTLWYLAEGSTDGGMETFVLVQNPHQTTVYAYVDFFTSTGAVPGPVNYPIPGGSRVTFKVNDFVTGYNVSTAVAASDDVICERAVYGNNRAWAHDSIGVATPSINWYMAEGSTDGGMETFVLVQNPNGVAATIYLDFTVGTGYVPGPQAYPIPAFSRVTFKVNDYVTDYNVASRVTSDLPVICERSVYGNNRAWAHDSIGTPSTEYVWNLAEGSTDGGMETFVLVMNPWGAAIPVSLDFMTSAGPVAGPQDFPVPALSRVTFKVNDYVTDYNVSTRVTSKVNGVVCERSMYGNNRAWAHDSIGYSP